MFISKFLSYVRGIEMGARERLFSIVGVVFVLVGVFSLIGFVRASIYTMSMKEPETVCKLKELDSFVSVENSIRNNTPERIIVYGYSTGCDCAVVKMDFPLAIEPYQERSVTCKLAASAFDCKGTTFRTVKFHHSSDSCDLVWRLCLEN